MITNWETQPTSPAESAIIAWLAAHPEAYRGKRLLHAGIGNSDLPAQFGPDLDQYVGFTISLPEVARFESRFPKPGNLRCVIVNKYDPRMQARITGTFDLIIDTLLKGYTCCERHFRDMLDWYVARLTPGGMILTTENGLRWGWTGNLARAYTPGAQTDPELGAARTLTHDALEAYAHARGLSRWHEGHPRWLAEPRAGDSLIILTKTGADVDAR